MLKKINFKFLIASVSAIGISYLTMEGIIQNYIHFTDPCNEMAFAGMAFFLGIAFTFNVKKD